MITNERTLKKSDLARFTGTQEYHLHWGGIRYTDGIQHLAEHGKCYWLLDLIASYQPRLLKTPAFREYQFWKLVVNGDNTALLTCVEDSDMEPAVSKRIPYTDFPLDEIEIWVEGGIVLLPSEH